MTADPYHWIEKSLNTLHRAHWHRTVKPLDGRAGPVVQLDDRPVINFASNDYLGLAGDPRLAAAAVAAIHHYGTGSTGSRLLSGHRPLHRQLETAIADLKQTEDAIVFSSGYLANLGTISALVGSRDLVLSDQYNHASLIGGARLSGASLHRYAHSDLADLQQQLETLRPQHRRCLIITDSVFSMDGDLCPLPQILDLAEAFDCMVLVDEAHGTGVLGQTGGGVVEHWGCRDRALVQIGTLSKALGSLGGYAAGSASLIDFLRNRASSWIYTTGLSPADTAAALKAIELVKVEPARRDRLWQHLARLQARLDSWLESLPNNPPAGVRRRLPTESPILCLEVTDAETVQHLGQALSAQGLFVSAVRPPTVPTSRLRITLMATHDTDHLEQLVRALAAVCQA